MASRSHRMRWWLAAALVVGAARSDAVEIIYAEAAYVHRTTGATASAVDGADVGAVLATLTAPAAAGFDIAKGEAYADDAGVFWTSARSGSLEPFTTRALALWRDVGIRQPGIDAVVADITSVNLVLLDDGSSLQADLMASLSFTAMLDGTTLFSHQVQLTGRSGTGFTVSEPFSLPGAVSTTTTRVRPNGEERSVSYLLDPLSLQIDLSSKAIGDSYKIEYVAEVRAANSGGETLASAWFRDPLALPGTGGITIRYVGVAEPSSLLLVGAGLLALAGARARGRRSTHRALPPDL